MLVMNEPKPIETPRADTDDLSALRLTRTEDGRYQAVWKGETTIVRVRTCFPWSAPGTFVSLRDEDDHEVVLVPDLAALDGESRAALERALRETAFAFTITRVERVYLEFEIRQWEVECAEGRRVFQTKVDDYPQPMAPSGLLITDVAGDVYVVPDWTALDKHSRKQLAMYVD